MAIKGGSIVHVGNGVSVIDRVQTGGPGQLNIPTEKINELGNYKSVATVRDTPDLTFSLESFDVSTEVEALVSGNVEPRSFEADMTAGDATLVSTDGAFTSADVGKQVVVPGAGANGGELVSTIATVTDANTVELADPAVTSTAADTSATVFLNGLDLSRCKPVDIASQFKAGKTAATPFRVTSSVAVPFLYVEQMSYRFGLRDNATQSAQLRGDTIFYNPGPTFVEDAPGSGNPGQVIVTDHPAYQVAEGDQRRVLAVTAGDRRLSFGVDYEETYGAVANGAATTTVTVTEAIPATDTLRIIYSSPDQVSYPQEIHPDTLVKPAAVKGRDIEIYLGGYDPADREGSAANKLKAVQSANVDYRVTIEKDEELGNAYAIGIDFDNPQVSGSVEIQPTDPQQLLQLLRKFTGVTDAQKVIGANSSVPLPLDIVIKHPDTGGVLKRLHVSDARFTVPGYQGRVVAKTNITVNFESDEGELLVFAR